MLRATFVERGRLVRMVFAVIDAAARVDGEENDVRPVLANHASHGIPIGQVKRHTSGNGTGVVSPRGLRAGALQGAHQALSQEPRGADHESLHQPPPRTGPHE